MHAAVGVACMLQSLGGEEWGQPRNSRCPAKIGCMLPLKCHSTSQRTALAAKSVMNLQHRARHTPVCVGHAAQLNPKYCGLHASVFQPTCIQYDIPSGIDPDDAGLVEAQDHLSCK